MEQKSTAPATTFLSLSADSLIALMTVAMSEVDKCGDRSRCNRRSLRGAKRA